MKKKIPIGLRRVLEEYSNYNDKLFQVTVGENSILTFTDIELESGYYFKIYEIINDKTTNNLPAYRISYLPSNEYSLQSNEKTVILKYIKEHFDKWLELLKLANEESTMFEDNFTKTYYDELEDKFKITDDDADIKPYSIDQQRKILLFLQKAKEIIGSQSVNSNNKSETIDLINKTEENLTTTTKQKTANNIRKILAKSFKMGITIGEKLLIEFTTELTKKLILGS